jgi:hypothetical protein
MLLEAWLALNNLTMGTLNVNYIILTALRVIWYAFIGSEFLVSL